MQKVEMATMCMIYDREHNKVLVQDRAKNWKGVAFPGGHVENGESLIDATIREVKEETGLYIDELVLCGVIHWYNNQNKERYIVFNFRTESWNGELLSETDEGIVFWVDANELENMNLSEGFSERLPMFFENKYIEGFAVWNENGTGKMIFK